MNSSARSRMIAFAGVYQAATLARQLARRGYADEAPLAVSIRSILITDAVNTESVYGGLGGVRLGLISMSRSSQDPGGLEVARYVIALVQLAHKLYRNPSLAEKITHGIDLLKAKQESDSSQIYAELAEIYKQTVSTLTPQIMVQGERGHLGKEVIVEQVRACLLAGIRSAFLWIQLGGKRWQLLFHRNRHVALAGQLLQKVEEVYERDI